ncbi:minor capsid protein [Tissierella sp. MSJ-40]|uniref:Minor capsid protein n=1 Tax=Tissierella simiarum TaxID=2841534 RepID=A0ABS6E9H7_9FIRM|nr:minor capsid protein [Tissierella simiarum]MBU5439496.1 minor capsid protein [Tissierella simiarum]
MKVKANIKLNQSNIKKIQEGMEKSLPLIMEAMKTEINNMQVVPKEIGDLEESAVVGVEEGKGYISYNTPYARRLYYHPEYDFRQDKNPNAQGRWLDPFIHGDKKAWLTVAFGEFLKQNSSGVIE